MERWRFDPNWKWMCMISPNNSQSGSEVKSQRLMLFLSILCVGSKIPLMKKLNGEVNSCLDPAQIQHPPRWTGGGGACQKAGKESVKQPLGEKAAWACHYRRGMKAHTATPASKKNRKWTGPENRRQWEYQIAAIRLPSPTFWPPSTLSAQTTIERPTHGGKNEQMTE